MSEIVNVVWKDICSIEDLVPNSGVAALIGKAQVAIFHLPKQIPEVYAIGNYDPIGRANVLSRGIVGDVDGQPAVASPLYKQHFRLCDGTCIEDDEVNAGSWPCRIEAGQVQLQFPREF